MNVLRRFVHQWSWLLLVSFSIFGLIFPVIGSVAIICMMAPVVVAFFKGRKWCGYFCPRGSFLDVFLTELSFKRQIPALFKRTWFKILGLVILMSAFLIQLFWAWGDFTEIGQVFVRMILLTTLLAVLLGILSRPRTWCLICPMGVLAQLIVKTELVANKMKRIYIRREYCIDCKQCTKKCPLNIDIHGFKNKGKVLNAACLQCEVCVAICPKKSLYVA